MKKEALFDIIGEINDNLLPKETRRRGPYRRLLTAAACIALCVCLALPILSQSTRLPLESTEGNISVRYTNRSPMRPHIYSPSLADRLTEDDVFGMKSTDIFHGEILSLRNIVINYGGQKEYRALAEILVHTVYKGDADIEAKTVTLLLPFGFWFVDDVWFEDASVIGQMKEGMEGIFLAMRYGVDDVSIVNGETLILKDIAQYGLRDGERFCILEGESGLIGDAITYESLFCNHPTATLEDAKKYVMDMLRE